MAEIARNYIKEIESLMEAMLVQKEEAGRSERGRLLAIAMTHLETAKLFIKETV